MVVLVGALLFWLFCEEKLANLIDMAILVILAILVIQADIKRWLWSEHWYSGAEKLQTQEEWAEVGGKLCL